MTCHHESQVQVCTIYGRMEMTRLCGNPTASDDFCSDHGADCKTCGDRFNVEDPSDPDAHECPDCAAETGRFVAEQRKTDPEYGKGV